MTPKIVQDLMGYKFELISAGGVTLFAATHDPKEGDFTCCWGQSALYGELALGPSAVRDSSVIYLSSLLTSSRCVTVKVCN